MNPRDSMSEEALMEAYRAGDGAAFGRLFSLLGPKLHGFFLRSFRSPAVADDLMQATFLKVHRAREHYRQGLPVRPWIFAIAARVRLDELRRMRRLPETADEEAVARAEDDDAEASRPDQAAEAGERAAQVRAALDSLPESQRTIVHLHRFEGLGYAEIARILGTTEGALKLRAFRAYGQLRKKLAALLPNAGGER